MTQYSVTLGAWLDIHAEPDLARVILDLAIAGTAIATLIRGGALTGALGTLEAVNVQGETQKRLDVLANDICKAQLAANPAVAAIASEEEDHAVTFSHPAARYLVAFDPLDGSSNVDVNVTVGTIFSILPASHPVPGDQAFLQPGDRQLAAGYIAYGPQVVLVLAIDGLAVQFTADSQTGQFILTHERLQIPSGTKTISANVSNMSRWAPSLAAAVSLCLRSGDYNMRWVGSMVADIHRILHQGGTFLYPAQADRPSGKLRLLYECNPIALIIKNADGSSIDTMNILPDKLHQRVGFIAGDQAQVDSFKAALASQNS
jgi:fructose-1,6-bisphosphatase I